MKIIRFFVLLLIFTFLFSTPSVVVLGQEANSLNLLYLPLVMKPCVKPILISPENAAQLDTLKPSFTFEIPPLTTQISVGLQISQETDFDDLEYSMGGSSSGGTATWRIFRNLTPATNYYWRVKANCGNSMVTYSDVRSFSTGSTGEILPAPVLLSPGDDTTTGSTQVIFDWEDVSGAVEYMIAYQEQGSYWWLTYVTNSTFTQNLQANTTYNWYAQAINDYAYGANSEVWSFTTPDP